MKEKNVRSASPQLISHNRLRWAKCFQYEHANGRKYFLSIDKSFYMAHPGQPRKCDPKVDNLRSDIRLGNYDIAKATLKEFGIDATDGDGRTALINAVIENKPDFINWLVGNGANINAQDKIGYSVLHFAGQNVLVDLAKYFLEKGANPNLQDIHGNTALWTAIFNAKLPTDEQGVVKLLLKFGADPDLLNKHGKTPKFIYQAFHNSDISTVETG